MAGRVVVSTLNNDTGVLATQNGMTGIAKAWVNFDGNFGGTPFVRSSFNVSSVTRAGTGDYTVNFTTAMPNANYCVTTSTSGVIQTNNQAYALMQTAVYNTTSIRVLAQGPASDFLIVNVAVISS
jgi:hypothetical protein